jgi:hypothetical protein
MVFSSPNLDEKARSGFDEFKLQYLPANMMVCFNLSIWYVGQGSGLARSRRFLGQSTK